MQRLASDKMAKLQSEAEQVVVKLRQQMDDYERLKASMTVAHKQSLLDQLSTCEADFARLAQSTSLPPPLEVIAYFVSLTVDGLR